MKIKTTPEKSTYYFVHLTAYFAKWQNHSTAGPFLGIFFRKKKMRRKANAGSIFFFQFFGHDFQKLNYFSRLRFLNILRKLCVGRLKLDGTTLR